MKQNNTIQQPITDNTVMAFGQYAGEKLANVPAEYLIFLYDNNRSGRYYHYIKKNIDTLKKQVLNQRRGIV